MHRSPRANDMVGDYALRVVPTTLEELISALQKNYSPAEDQEVVRVVSHLMSTGQLRLAPPSSNVHRDLV